MDHRALVLISGKLSQLPSGDSLAGVSTTGLATAADLTQTGATLLGLITASSAGVSSLNGGSGAMTLAGAGTVSISRVGQVITISGSGAGGAGDVTFAQLAATGAMLAGRIDSLSGYSDSTFATKTQLTNTGVNLGALVAGVSGGLEARIAATGSSAYQGAVTLVAAVDTRLTLTGVTLGARIDTLTTALTNTGVDLRAQLTGLSGQAVSTYATISNLALTGANLRAQLTGLSGQAVATYATITNLTSTGQQLFALVTGLSGQAVSTYATQSALASTGGQAWNHGQNNALNLSGALAASGAALIALNLVTSGTLASGLTATGSTLWQRDLSISGALAAQISAAAAGVATLNGLSGSLTLVGTGSVTITTAGQSIIVSGSAGAGDVTSTQLTSTGVQLGATIAATGQNLYTLLTGLSGQSVTDYAAKTQVTQSGVLLGARIDTVTSNLALTGQALYTHLTGLSGQAVSTYATIANLQSTGQQTFALITGLSGQAVATYATISNLALTGSQAWNHGQNNALNLSGALAASGAALINRDNAISGILDGRLALTGSGLYTLLTGLSGQARTDYATVANLQTTGQSLFALVTGLSGQAVSTYATQAALASTGQQAWTAASSNGLNLSGALAASGAALITRDNAISGVLDGRLALTGSGLYTLITGLSGQANLDFTTKSQLTLTGQTLGARDDAISGVLDARLALTGSGLFTHITGLSGWANSTFATQSALASTGGQAWNHGQNNALNLSGRLAETGAVLLGLITAASAGVSSLNGASGAITVQGAGSVTVTTSAQTITVSGGALTVTGSTTLTAPNFVGIGGALVIRSGANTVVISGGAGGGGVTAGQLESTGQQAWDAANNNGINLSGRLTAVSGGLQAQISAVSGVLDARLALTGSGLATNLTVTGLVLNQRIDVLVGNLLLTGQTLTTNLAATGTTLDGRINALSGYFAPGQANYVYTTGDQSVGGIKTLTSELRLYAGLKLPTQYFGDANYTFNTGNLLHVATGAQAGVTGILPAPGLYSGVQWVIVNNKGFPLQLSGIIGPDVNPTIAPYDAVNVVGSSGVWNYIRQTGGFATTAALAATGQQAWVNADTNARTISGNLTQTGVLLGARIDTLTTNLTLTGQTLGAKVDSVSGWAASAVNLALTGSNLYALVTGLSGQAVSSYATIANLASTGQQAFNLITGLSGQAVSTYATTINLTLTGQTLGANLAATGSNLYVLVTGLSGQSVTDYATKALLASTGQQAWDAQRNNALNLSGALTNTGVALIGRDNAISGVLDARLALTGSGLYTLITGLSGQANTDFATKTMLTQSGVNLGARIDTVAANLALTGQGLFTLVTGLSGQAVIDYATKAALGATGQANWVATATTGSNLYVLITGLSGQSVTDYATKSQLTQTGVLLGARIDTDVANLTATGATLRQRDLDISGVLSAQIQASAAGVSTLNSLSGAVTLAGAGLVSISAAGQTITISGSVPSSGVLSPAFNYASGALVVLTADPTKTNQQLRLVQSGVNTVLVVTGVWNGCNGTVIVSKHFGGTGSISLHPSAHIFGNPGTNVVSLSTGAGVYDALAFAYDGDLRPYWTVSTLTGIGGGGNGDVTASQLAATGQQAWTAADTNAVILSGKLTQTGVLLGARIDTLTSNLASTGQQAWDHGQNNALNLSGRLATLSGYADTTFATKTQLTQTGVALWQRDLDISGALQSQIAGANGTQVTVTGSSTLGFAGLTGLGSVTVTLDGTQVLISGAAGGGDVTSSQLTSTGVQLVARDLAISGVLSASMSPPYAFVSGHALTLNIDPSKASQNLNILATGADITLTLAGAYNGANGTILVHKRHDGEATIWVAGDPYIINGPSPTLSGLRLTSGSGGYDAFSFTHNGLRSIWAVSTLSGATGGGGVGDVTSAQLTSTGVQLMGHITGLSGNMVARDLTLSGVFASRSVDGQVIVNRGGYFSGDVNLTWNDITESLNLGQASILTNNPLAVGGSGAYLQANIQNRSALFDASSDWVATANNGNDTTNYVNLGINSSGYNQTGYSIGSSGDAYLYNNGGHLTIGTQTPGKVLKLHVGGTTGGALKATVDESGINLPSGYTYRIGGAGPTFTKGGSFYNPDGIPSGLHRVPVWYAPFACTATAVRGFILSGTSATVNALKGNQLRLLNSNLSVTPTGAWINTTTLQNNVFAIGDSLTLEIANTVNGPVSVGIQVDFTRG